jgi:hypothetical protein
VIVGGSDAEVEGRITAYREAIVDAFQVLYDLREYGGR